MFERIYQDIFYKFLFRFWRSGRKKLFLARMLPRCAKNLLDVGGSATFWQDENLGGCHLAILNLPKGLPSGPWRGQRVSVALGDGCFLPFGNSAFDIVFSNSVIEHLSSWDKQQRFAAEALRVGRAIWIQTPAYECPFEAHFLAPFFHWLPTSWRTALARNFTLWGLLHRPTPEACQRMVAEIRLLKKGEMVALFPGCEIWTERILGVFPKSYIAFRRSKQS